MGDDKKNCDLCGLTVEVSGFDLKTKQGSQHFCCEGCKGIYQLLHEDEILDDEENRATN
ncbi:MAG: heavy metal translocating P-type ATPase metal-binding domain-containing protein [Methylococcales bacterium]